MKRNIFALLWVALPLALALLAGCGGSGTDAGASAQVPGQAEPSGAAPSTEGSAPVLADFRVTDWAVPIAVDEIPENGRAWWAVSYQDEDLDATAAYITVYRDEGQGGWQGWSSITWVLTPQSQMAEEQFSEMNVDHLPIGRYRAECELLDSGNHGSNLLETTFSIVPASGKKR